jgi:hypothetical protein
MAIRSEQINVENNKLIIGTTVNSVSNVGKAYSAHADSQLTFSVDATGTAGIKLLLRDGAVKGVSNADGDASQIEAGSIGTADIADSAITAAKIAADAVTSAEILGADGAAATASFNFTGITGSFQVPTPVNDSDAATKLYVDDIARGLDYKDSVEAATTASDTLSGNLSGFAYSSAVLSESTPSIASLTVDGVTIGTLGDRVLVKDRQDASENGIYELTQIGDGSTTAWELSRTSDFNDDAEVTAGAYVLVTEGSTQSLNAYVVQAKSGGGDPTLDTDDINWLLFSGSATAVQGGDGISVSGTTVAVDFDANGALEFDAGKLAVVVDGETIGINAVDNDLEVKIGGTNASLEYDATAGSEGLAVKVDAETVAIGADGLKASILKQGEDQTSKSAVSTSTGSTGVTVEGNPAAGAEIYVFINGVMQVVGDNTTASVDVFFMPSGASNTADVRAFADVVDGDVLWFNPGVAGFDFATTDEVRIVFSAKA